MPRHGVSNDAARKLYRFVQLVEALPDRKSVV
jgi:hypothetical protein